MKNKFLSNILLTFIWVALTGNFVMANFIFGFILSFFIMKMISKDTGEVNYFRVLPKAISFIFYFLSELVKANLQVAYEVMTPKYGMTAGIVGFPLEAKTDLEISFLANLISLTPGTLSLEVSDDRKILYVHSMYIKDREDFINSIKNGFEKRILEILR